MGNDFKYDDVVIYLPEMKEYTFAYYSQVEGKAVIYEMGCHNMQDSFAVDIKNLKKVNT